MTDTAYAVVIGGGILGASTAHFLCKHDVGKVILIEKGGLASGSTGRSAANVRQHYSHPTGIQLAVRARQMFADADERLGGPAGFIQCGYLVLAPEGEESAIKTVVPRQQELGVDTAVLEVAEIEARFPSLDLTGITLGCLEPTSGYADPCLTVRSLVESAQPAGLVVREHTEVTAILVKRGRVHGVLAGGKRIATPVVVNAAGPWAERVGAMAGVRYTLHLSREHEAVFHVPEVPGDIPIVSDAANRIFFRPAGGANILIGEGYPKAQEPCGPDANQDGADDHVIQRMAARLARRVPILERVLNDGGYHARLVHDYTGVYSITEDWYPIVGRDPTVEGYYSAVGGSGHAFKIGPPIGESLAAVICGRTPPIDLTPIRATRFEEGERCESVWGPGNRA